MDQTITGAAGIESAEAFGGQPAAVHQRFLVGTAGIESGEAFGRTDGVRIPIETVPVASWYAY